MCVEAGEASIRESSKAISVFALYLYNKSRFSLLYDRAHKSCWGKMTNPSLRINSFCSSVSELNSVGSVNRGLSGVFLLTVKGNKRTDRAAFFTF